MMKNKQAAIWEIVIRTQGLRNQLLIEALYSAATQSYANKALIVVTHAADALAIQEIKAIAEKFSHYCPIKVVQADPTKKRGHPLNIGLKNSHLQLLTFLDDDDLLYPYMGELLIAEIDKQNLDFAYGESIGLFQKIINGQLKTINKEKIWGEAFDYLRLFSGNYIHFSSLVFNFCHFPKLNFQEELSVYEDWELLLHLALENHRSGLFIPTAVSEARKIDNVDSFQKEGEILFNDSVSKIREIIKQSPKAKELIVEAFTNYQDHYSFSQIF